MEVKKDITNIEDVKLLVNTFYGDVRLDPLIGPIFESVIEDRWPAHLEKMYSFWQTVLLGEHTYSGAPFLPHANLPVEVEHFQTWLSIWWRTVDRFFSGPVADEAKWRGERMASMFLSKIEYFRTRPARPLI